MGFHVPILFCCLSMAKQFSSLSHSMSEVLEKLQLVEAIEEESDFLVISEEDLEASVEEHRNSCYGKFLVDHELNILNIRRCLRHAWCGHDFRVCKVGEVCTSFSLRKKNWWNISCLMDHGVLMIICCC